MSKEKLRFFIDYLFIPSIIAVAGCTASVTDSAVDDVSFMLIDVGQGLSQVVVEGDEAMLFDMGPVDAEQEWKKAYASIGKPYITAIVVSHRDLDHSGGLHFIDSAVDWSGTLVVSPWEDTVFLREQCSNWCRPVRFETVVQDDTVEFTDDCFVRCLWPPPLIDDPVPVPDTKTNFYSIVCRITHGNTSVMTTGDIDSVAQRFITRRYATQLRSDIVVVPHHGSAGAAYPLFYGYIRPYQAAISCGEGNPYGHPSSEVLTMFFHLAVNCVTTSGSGTLLWKSNGFYWNERF
ncbi:MAG: hypothetical protein JXA18_14990 [Chitinispirillaceae bacterium]|nr:hypothetical protein [Chitinispirillaceae bacterium]